MQAGCSIRKTAGDGVRELGSGADHAGLVLGSPGGWAPTESVGFKAGMERLGLPQVGDLEP